MRQSPFSNKQSVQRVSMLQSGAPRRNQNAALEDLNRRVHPQKRFLPPIEQKTMYTVKAIFPVQLVIVLLLGALLLINNDAAVHSDTKTPPVSKKPAKGHVRPVVVIPGFASSQLHSWNHVSCVHPVQKNLYRNVDVGDRLWLDVTRLFAQNECWIQCMSLNAEDQSDMNCKLRAAEGLSAISELDPGVVTGPLSTIWSRMGQDLIENFQLDPGQLIVASYDWRLPPSKLQERDNYFLSLKKKIEFAVDVHGESTEGAVVIAHSLGNNIFRYFLEWLKSEVGVNHWEEWISKYISTYFALGSPHLGSPGALELITSGTTEGLPISPKDMRRLVLSFGSILSFMPIATLPYDDQDSEVLISIAHKDKYGEKVVKNYTTLDVASGDFYRQMADQDPIFSNLAIIRKVFYDNDPVMDFTKPWERPPIKRIYSAYGVNLPTNYRYSYEDAVREWYQLTVRVEEGQDHVCSKTGDGTAPYHSLSWAHTWLGRDGSDVNVTVVPQSVYFSSDRTQKALAKRDASVHHAGYKQVSEHEGRLCHDTGKGSTGFLGSFFRTDDNKKISFFERTEEVNGEEQVTAVWEMDGMNHREMLSHPIFLRELRAELHHLFFDEEGRPTSDKSKRPPVMNSDCYWNYGAAKCEFSEYCEYRYEFGDVVLDQSCRVKPNEQHTFVSVEENSTDAPLDLMDDTCDADSSTCPEMV